ncbi:MAG: ABC transporter substrate-binding protein, partial [Coriobacteriales bacterium]
IYPNFYSSADNNYAKYNNPAVDKAIDAARQVTDDDERREKYREVNQVIAADLPVIPIMFYAHNHVASDKIKSLYYDPQGKADLANTKLV